MGKIKFKLIITYAFCFILLAINIFFISNINKEAPSLEETTQEINFTEIQFSGTSETISRNLLMSQTNSDEELFFQPSLTFLTHGLGASASIWSNDGTSFQYDPDSLIESLRLSAGDAVVYLAKVYEKVEDEYIFGLWELAEGVYQYGADGVNYISQFRLEDLSKHMIIVFESRQGEYIDESGNLSNYNLQDLRSVYDEFDYVVDSILYEIRQLSGALPKINVIGHNTGGIINLIYSTEHPKIVSSLFSIGTPYNGLIGDGVSIAQNWINDNVLNSDGYKNLLDKDFISDLKSRWNAISAQNYNINTFALGGATAYDIIQNFFNNGKFEDLTFWGSKITLDELKILFSTIIDKLTDTPEKDKVLSSISTYANQILQSLKAIGIEVFSLENIKNLIIELQLFTHSIFNKTEEEAPYNDEYLFLNDMFSGLESQLAKGYNGFVDYAKLFTASNCNLSLSNSGISVVQTVNEISPLAGDFIDYIINNLLMVATPILYDYTHISDEYGNEGIRLDGYKLEQYLNNEDYSYITSKYVETLKLPEKLMFKNVTQIGSDFGKSLHSNIKRVILHPYVNIVEEKAFYDCDDIELIRMSGQTVIGENAFSRCDNLSIEIYTDFSNEYWCSEAGSLYTRDKAVLIKYSSKEEADFRLFDSVKKIDSEAFADTDIKSINLNKVEFIGPSAFLNCSNLLKPQIENDKIKVLAKDAFTNSHWMNISEEDFIVLGDILIGYKGQETDIVLDSSIRLISDYVFAESQINTISTDSESSIIIGNYAFIDSCLSEVNLRVRNVGHYAFSNTNITNLDTSKLERAENFAFANTNIEKIDLSKAKYIGSNVIDNCFNLKELTIPINVISYSYIRTGDECYVGDGGGHFYYCTMYQESMDYGGGSRYRSVIYKGNTFNLLNTLDRVYFHASHDGITFYPYTDCSHLNIDLFNNCKSSLEVYIPHYYASDFENSEIFANHQSNLSFIAVKIDFDSDSEMEITDIIDTFYYAEINQNSFPKPTKRGYSFIGWYDEDDNYYWDKEMVIYKNDFTLTARWAINQYNIFYEINTDYVVFDNPINNFTVLSDFVLQIPYRKGYDFKGWYNEYIVDEYGDKQMIGDPIVTFNGQFADDLILFPLWEKRTAKVYLMDEQIPQDYYVTFYYDTFIGDILPQIDRVGLDFVYWYDEEYGLHYDSNIYWQEERNTIYLVSVWKPTIYNIYFMTTDQVFDTVTIEYDDELSVDHLPIPQRLYYTFGGWYNADVPSYDGADYGRIFCFGEKWNIDSDLTVFALWDYTVYHLFFKESGDPIPTSIVYHSPTDPFMTLNKDNYIFGGWTHQDLDGIPIDNISIWNYIYLADENNMITLTPIWIPIEYNVSFNSNGGTIIEPINVTYNDEVGILEEPQKEGYDFIGWFYDDILYTPETKWNGKESILETRWEGKEYNISFDSNGGAEISNKTVIFFEPVGSLDTPQLSLYTFVGWYYGERQITEDSVWDIPANVELVAKWCITLYFKLNFSDSDENIIEIRINTGETFKIEQPEREGYYFIGWYQNEQEYFTDGEGIGEIELASDPYYYAQWEVERYQFKIFGSNYYLNDEGCTEEDAFLPYGNILLDDIFESFYGKFCGKIFQHLSYNEEKIDWSQGIPDYGDNDAIITLYPICETEEHTIVFKLDEQESPSTFEPIVQNYGTEISLPTPLNLIRDMEFVRWQTLDGEAFEFTNMPDITQDSEGSGTIELVAVWQPRRYMITFDTDGGNEIAPIYLEYQQAFGELVTPTKKGYTFIGWTHNDELIGDVWLYRNQGILIARWTEKDYVINTYIDEELFESKTVWYDKQFFLIPAHKPGYVFNGWYDVSNTRITDNSGRSLSKWSIADDINLFAKWTYEIFNIYYVMNNGNNDERNPYSYMIIDNINLYQSTRIGYDFAGWYYYDVDAQQKYGERIYTIGFNILKSHLADIFLYAEWSARSYNITLDVAGGESLDDILFVMEYDKCDFIISRIPTRQNYYFVGWSDENNDYYTDNKGNAVRKWDKASDCTLYARWQGKNCQVYLDAQDSEVILQNPLRTLVYGDFFGLPVLMKAGYSFLGWYDANGIKYTNDNGVSIRAWNNSNLTILYAHWQVVEYSITYVLGGGTNHIENPAVYTIADGNILLQSPTKEGYRFMGWKDENGVYITYIAANQLRDVTLTAVWRIDYE